MRKEINCLRIQKKEENKMKIKLIIGWFDFWIGFYFDRKKKCLYFFFIPMVGFLFMRKGNYCIWCKQPKRDDEMNCYESCKKCDSEGGYVS